MGTTRILDFSSGQCLVTKASGQMSKGSLLGFKPVLGLHHLGEKEDLCVRRRLVKQ